MSDSINYTKEAFMSPWNLAFLIVAMLTAFFLSDQALAPEVILTFTAAIELLFLGIVPRHPRYQRLVRSRQIAETQKPASDAERFRDLSRDDQKRYVRFRTLEKQIRENYKRLPYASQGMLDAHLKKIDGLLDAYLNLLLLKDRYEQFTIRSTEGEVVNSIAALQEDLKDDPPKVRAIKERRLAILEKRLLKFKKAHENLEVIQAQLETIEDVTKYIYEQSLTMRNPEEVSFQLDTLVSEVEETQASVERLEEVFGQADLLADIDTYLDPSSESPETNRPRSREGL